MDDYIKSIYKYNFNFLPKQSIDFEKFEIIQSGIGDILLAILCLYNKCFKNKQILFNINIYVNNVYNINNPFNSFEFKLKLLDYFLDSSVVYFYFDENINYTNWHNQIKYINNYNLFNFSLKKYESPNQSINKYTKYAIFHTKCRFYNTFDYMTLKKNLATFFRTFKTKYKIIILGEREMPNNSECKIHNITTIYKELLLLNINNDVIDLTLENIYDKLDFDCYMKDMILIKNADVNIGVGHGGQYVNSIIFGKKSLFFQTPNLVKILDINKLYKKNHYSCFNLIQYFESIELFM